MEMVSRARLQHALESLQEILRGSPTNPKMVREGLSDISAVIGEVTRRHDPSLSGSQVDALKQASGSVEDALSAMDIQIGAGQLKLPRNSSELVIGIKMRTDNGLRALAAVFVSHAQTSLTAAIRAFPPVPDVKNDRTAVPRRVHPRSVKPSVTPLRTPSPPSSPTVGVAATPTIKRLSVLSEAEKERLSSGVRKLGELVRARPPK